MKKGLEEIFRSYGQLSEKDIARGLDYFSPRSYKKGDFIIEAGQTCNLIAFIRFGIVRNFYISRKDEEVTYCMTFPNNFITAYSSFISSEKTFENIHALTYTEVLVIKKNDLLKLSSTSANWLKFSNYFSEQSYILMEKRLLILQMESAEKRYNDLMSNHPEMIQYVPLKYIASYLGITQRHLSRLRKNIL